MEQTVHMTLSGHAEPFPLTPAAHRLLLHYLAEARTTLASEPDGDETVRDLETAIGERLAALTADVQSVSALPIDDGQMKDVLAAVGTVSLARSIPGGARHSPRGPFWCRITEGKWFGGICLGIAARGGFNADWVRTVVFFLLLLTGGFLGLVYLALLLVLPPVATVEEYERMREAPKPER